MGMPVTNGFIGELYVLIGAFRANWAFTIPVVIGILLGAVYLLWMFQRVFLGGFIYNGHSPLNDLDFREKAAMVPVLILVFWIGLYPVPFLKITDASLSNLVQTIEQNSKKSVLAGELSAGHHAGLAGFRPGLIPVAKVSDR